MNTGDHIIRLNSMACAIYVVYSKPITKLYGYYVNVSLYCVYEYYLCRSKLEHFLEPRYYTIQHPSCHLKCVSKSVSICLYFMLISAVKGLATSVYVSAHAAV